MRLETDEGATLGEVAAEGRSDERTEGVGGEAGQERTSLPE